MKRQRRRYRDAEGIEEVGIAEGVGVLPQPTRGLGSVVSSPSRVQGGGPAANAVSALFDYHRTL